MTATEAQRLAERVYRAQGNQQGRGRMRADATLKPTLYPRGLTVGTGEDLPAGKSLRARLMALEFGPDTLDWDQITTLQRLAAEGVFAEALAGFVQWLAPDYDTFLREELPARIAEQRERAADSRYHRRTPELIASLHAGLYALLDFATDIDAIDAFEADKLNAEGWEALGEAADLQLPHQASADLPAQFLALLRSALTGGTAHVADAQDGNRPPEPWRWGWVRFETADAERVAPGGDPGRLGCGRRPAARSQPRARSGPARGPGPGRAPRRHRQHPRQAALRAEPVAIDRAAHPPDVPGPPHDRRLTRLCAPPRHHGARPTRRERRPDPPDRAPDHKRPRRDPHRSGNWSGRSGHSTPQPPTSIGARHAGPEQRGPSPPNRPDQARPTRQRRRTSRWPTGSPGLPKGTLAEVRSWRLDNCGTTFRMIFSGAVLDTQRQPPSARRDPARVLGAASRRKAEVTG